MKNSNATAQAKNKGSEMLVLLIIGVLGVAGLLYVLNSSSSKSGFSDNISAPAVTEYVVQN
jgi:hypothetical protein